MMQLTQRERYAIYAASVLICLFVLMQFIVFPFFDRRERVARAIEVKTKILEDMLILKSEYDAINKKTESAKGRFAKKKTGSTLFSFLDKLAGEAGIKENIAYMKPSTSAQKNSQYRISTVELKLQNIILKQLVSYLHKVETSNNMVRVKRLSISKTGKDVGFINAVLQVETVEI